MQCLADVRVDLYISLIDFRLFVLLSKGLLESLRSYQRYSYIQVRFLKSVQIFGCDSPIIVGTFILIVASCLY
ncbi:hypothetical protein IMY05_006G0154800 [Salix suchowensis]|nr:hypothetical protein IMY05_006G0154800 [Salix suchowensis]